MPAGRRTRHDAWVELRVDAGADQLPVIRVAAESFGLLVGFDRDTVAELKLAVDEACSQLLSRVAAANAELVCAFSRDGDNTVRVRASAPIDGADIGSGFGWHVLRTLTDEASAFLEDGGAGQTVVEFVKRQ